MSKIKVIKVKHYLNKEIKPILINDLKYYPLYFEVGYNRKANQFRSVFDKYVCEKDIETALNQKDIIDEIELINKIIRRREKLNLDIKLTELAHYIEFYNKKISDWLKEKIDRYFKNRFNSKFDLLYYIDFSKIDNYIDFTEAFNSFAEMNIKEYLEIDNQASRFFNEYIALYKLKKHYNIIEFLNSKKLINTFVWLSSYLFEIEKITPVSSLEVENKSAKTELSNNNKKIFLPFK